MSEIFAAKYAIPHMLEQGSGYLLNVASAAGLLVIFDTVGYTVTKHAAIGFTEWLAATYGDQGIGVSVLVPAAVLTPILAGKEDTPEGQDAITTDQLADIVIEGLAEERFMINTHPWVLEKFAVKARDYDEYIRMLRADRAAAAAAKSGGVSHAPRRHRRLRVRRAVRRQGAATRPGRGGGGRSHQPPPLPAAALPGRHRGALRGRHRAADPRRPATPAQRAGRARRGRRHRRRRAGSSTIDTLGHHDDAVLRQPDRRDRRVAVVLRPRRVRPCTRRA